MEHYKTILLKRLGRNIRELNALKTDHTKFRKNDRIRQLENRITNDSYTLKKICFAEIENR